MRGPKTLRSQLVGLPLLVALISVNTTLSAQQMVTETRDPRQNQDPDFAAAYVEWTGNPIYGSPLVDHLPRVPGIPMPKDILGYHIGAPATLTYYADILRYYKALAAASPRVMIETIGRSDEDRELVVVWISSEENIRNLQRNRDNLARIADPRGMNEEQARQLIAATKPQYHLIGGLHSGETGPSEMLMELAYRLAAETSPLITQIRNNVYVSITPAAEPDGRDRNVDWFYMGLEQSAAGGRGGGGVPYWGKYVYHDNNRDINLSQMSMRAITDWYYTAHPPIMHDLHESLSLMYTYSGGPPQNPNLDPILFSELPFFSNWEMSQMTKWGMPGVYTHAFMDGWSPGYLGSVAYNHNGMMRMYETQSGRDGFAPAGGAGGRAGGAAAAGGRGGRGGGAGGAGGAGGRGAGGGGGGAAAAAAAAGDANTVVAVGGGSTMAVDSSAAAAGRGGRGTPAGVAPAGRGGGGGRGGSGGTGRGGGQPREWYRGIPVPPGAAAEFTRRNNTNYMQTGVLSALQLTSMFPNLVVENFYVKTRNSMTAGATSAPYAYVIPVQRDMTRAVTLVNILRAQGIEIGLLSAATAVGDATFPAGSYVVKLNQPYGRLAKNLLEKQDYPDADMRTYDDSGWSMGLAINVDVREIRDSSILAAPATLVDSARWKGSVTGSAASGIAVAHYGSNNMISFRYAMRNTAMRIANDSFAVAGMNFPAGSYILTGSAGDVQRARALVDSLGLTAATFASAPTVSTHDGEAPRIAIYSQWSGTQELGWYRHAFDQFGIPYDLIFKERVMLGGLERDYDVIIMAAQNVNRNAVLAAPAARPQPYKKSDKYKFLGMYGETEDMSGGFGEVGVRAFEKFFEAGGTLIATSSAVSFPIDFGFARSVSTEGATGVNAQKPLIQARVSRLDHPVFYGYDNEIFPIKYGGSQLFRIGVADQGNTLATYVGGEASVLSGLMEGAENIEGRAFAVDVPGAFNGKGRVIMFANNPMYRWQNHGEFNMVFNSILNWNDVPEPLPLTPAAGGGRGGRGGPGGGPAGR